jgi:hypothetical protein
VARVGASTTIGRAGFGLLLLSMGCYSGRGDLHASGGGNSAGDAGDDGGSADDDGGDDGGSSGELGAGDSRFPRLSHAQWENTVRDLFQLPEVIGLSSAFVDDPTASGFDNKGSAFDVGNTLWGDYQRAAEAVAELVTSDPAIVAAIAPADTGQGLEARATEFVQSFGLRAWRRPLTEAEVATMVSIFLDATADYDIDPFTAGVHLTVQAMLQSPYFIYRVVDGEPEDDGRVRLDGFERASRLSYSLWNTMPDDDLFAAAQAGELDEPEGVLAQAERMLDDERAQLMVEDFHHQLFKMDKYLDQHRDAGLYPSFDPAVGTAMQAEAKAFIRSIVFERNEGYADLLTATHSWANADIAAIYGLQGDFGSELQPVELDPAQRSGLLTRSGFLMSLSHAVDPDPIHRGVFVSFELLCNLQPPIPDNVTSVEPDPTKTNRERVTDHTGAGTCGAGCHDSLINPAGFAFENYDAIGAWRTMDNGKPVDAAAEFFFDGELHAYENAIELSQLLADSPQAHACYAKHLLEYTYARIPHETDEESLEALGAASVAGDLSIRGVITELVTSDDFLFMHDATEEDS